MQSNDVYSEVKGFFSKPTFQNLLVYKPYNNQYKCLPFLAALSMSLALCHYLFWNKLILTSLGIMSVGSLLVPFWAISSDIIAEVYGLKMFMRIYWNTMTLVIIIQIIFFICTVLSTSNVKHQHQYHVVLGQMFNFFVFIYLFAASYISSRINASLLTKWKNLINGSKFWLRSVGSTMASDILFLSMAIPAWFYLGTADNVKDAITLSCCSLFYRLLIYVVLSIPANVIVNLLKVIERIKMKEDNKFNPFLLSESIEAKS